MCRLAIWLLLLGQQTQTSSGGMSQPEGCAIDSARGSCACADAVGNIWDLGPDVGTLGPIMGPCNGLFCSGQWRCTLSSILMSATCTDMRPDVHCTLPTGNSILELLRVLRVTLHCVCPVCVDYIGICENIPVFQGIGCSAAALASAFRIDTWAVCPPATSCECELMGINMQSEMSVGVRALDGDDGFVLQNVRDTGRSIEISVVCDRSVPKDNPPDPVTDAANHVTMTWRTPLVCARRLDLGWMFLIATGVATGLYVGGGIAYAKHMVSLS